MLDLTEEQAATRNAVLLETDDNTCQGCGAVPGPGAADDSEWFVDTYVGALDDFGGPVLHSIIRCPSCW